MTMKKPNNPLSPVFDVRTSSGAQAVGNSWGADRPIACFTESAPSGLTANLDAGCSTDPIGTILGWSWDFGDSTTSALGPTVSHLYAGAGTYVVTLVVINDQNVPSVAFVDNVTV